MNLTGTGFEDEGLVREGGDILTLSSEESGTGEEWGLLYSGGGRRGEEGQGLVEG